MTKDLQQDEVPEGESHPRGRCGAERGLCAMLCSLLFAEGLRPAGWMVTAASISSIPWGTGTQTLLLTSLVLRLLQEPA